MDPTLIPKAWATTELVAAVAAIDDSVFENSVLPPEQVFRALTYFPPDECQVLILGQDPYPGSIKMEGSLYAKANGLAFGISQVWRDLYRTKRLLTSSFGNIAAEVARANPEFPKSGDFKLEFWARQGVLLLNADLTCAPGRPGSHRGVWRAVVRAILSQLRGDTVKVAFGSVARDLPSATTWRWDIALPHPCRHSAHRGFIGCDFARGVNEILRSSDRREIVW